MLSEKYTEHLKNHKTLYLSLVNIGIYIFFSSISGFYFFEIFLLLFIANYFFCYFIYNEKNKQVKDAMFYLSNFIISFLFFVHLVLLVNPNEKFDNGKIISENFLTKNIHPPPKHGNFEVYRENGKSIYLDCSSITAGVCPNINWDEKIKVEYILLENPFFISKYLLGVDDRMFIYGIYINDKAYKDKYSNQFFINRYHQEYHLKHKISVFFAFYVLYVFFMALIKIIHIKYFFIKSLFNLIFYCTVTVMWSFFFFFSSSIDIIERYFFMNGSVLELAEFSDNKFSLFATFCTKSVGWVE